MPTNRKVKGYIFKTRMLGYYKAYAQGFTMRKGAAYVYSMEEAVAYGLKISGWGGKTQGKWQVVYE